MRFALTLLLVAACVDLPPGGDAGNPPTCTELGCAAAYCNAPRTECRCLPPGSSETVPCDGTAQPDGGR